jgi:nucleoside-diphosphate kinase
MTQDPTCERTFLLIKPDAVQRGLIGQIISRFELKGLKIVGLKMVKISPDQAKRQYACHEGKAFYDSLITFMTSGPALALVVEGRNAITLARKIMGATDPLGAEPGTIRGDFSVDTKHNLVHGSDSHESVQHELPIYFLPEELQSYELNIKPWLYYL